MRKLFFPLLAAAVLAACSSNETASVKGTTDSTTRTASVSLPYPVNPVPDWERGNPANVAIAMNTLKAFVDNDMTTVRQYLADSVEFYADNVAFKGSGDSLVKFFTDQRRRWDSITIRMQDYESVQSKSRGQEWVSMWYVETDLQKGGATDSAMVMDDIRIENGKVRVIDSKARRLKR